MDRGYPPRKGALTKRTIVSPVLALAALLLGVACASAPDEATPISPPAAAATVAAPTATATPPPTPTASPAKPLGLPRIAFVSPEGGISVMRADGSDLVTLTAAPDQTPNREATHYNWPTWDPQGKRLAFSSITPREDTPDMTLLVARADGSELREVYRNPSTKTLSLVAPNAPHYIYWSPSGEDIAFLASGGPSGGLALLLADPEGQGQAREVIQGAPLYLAWDGMGQALLLHVGGELQLVDTGLPLRPAHLGARSLAYRVPAWSPDARRIAYVGPTEGGSGLFVTRVGQALERGLLPVPGRAAFLWSPEREEIAIALGKGTPPVPYDRILLVDTIDGSVQELVQEPLFAFFWSPDGRKLAYVAPTAAEGEMELKVVTAGGTPRSLATFRPTQGMAIYLTFFDQYTYSNSIWSPDNRYLVLAGGLAEEEEAEPRIIIVDSEGVESPEVIAQGSLAFWAPK